MLRDRYTLLLSQYPRVVTNLDLLLWPALTGGHPETGACQVTEPGAQTPWCPARNPWPSSATFQRFDAASAPAAGEQLTEPIPGGTPDRSTRLDSKR